MVRKLAFGSALTAAVLPTWAFALGLGDIDLHSHLNQPLQAQIPLVAAEREELDSLRVTLASPADFARAGLDWQNNLRSLRFSVDSESGRPVIRVTTNEDFREPFLSFLLEVNWSRGRVLREYTVLVDPPVFTDRRTTVAAAPPVQQRTAPAEAKPAQPASAPPRRSVAAAPRGLPAAAQTPTEYGPTQRQDTLWTIAQQVRPDESVTVEQTMLGLQRLNPDAFIDENVNRLKAGHVLKVPDLAAIESMDAAAARTEFRRQTRVWRTGAAPETTVATAAPEPAPSGRLRLLAPEAAGGESGDNAAGGASGESPGAGAADDEIAAAEANAAVRAENVELRERIAELQQQLEQLQTVATLKDDQLAALEQQLRALNAEQPQSAESPQVDAAAAPPAEAETPAGLSTPAETKVQYSAPVPAVPAPGQPSNPYVVEGFEPVDLTTLPTDAPQQPFTTFEEPASVAEQGATVAAQEPVPAEPAVSAGATLLERARAALNGTLEYARTNPLYAAGAGAVLLLIILALLLTRQRRRTAAGFGESILQETRRGEADALAAAAAVTGAAAAAPASEDRSSDSSYLSDFGVSGIDSSIESEVSEADPLTEADVFLAYGRFQPAENMIKEAIDNEPERLDLKAKLLEIYFAAKDRGAFEREAHLYHSLVEDHSGTDWQKVAEMGRELCPDNPLFRDEEPAAESAAVEPTQTIEAVAPGLETADNAHEDELAVGFGDDAVAMSAAAETALGADENLIDFDLGEFEDLPRTAESGQQVAASGGLDFDIDMDFDSTAEAASPGAADDGFAALGDELSKLNEGSAGTGSDSTSADQDVAEFDLSELGVDLDGIEQHPAAAQPEAAEEATADEEPLLASAEDEVGTKLDLARAYIDMGDPDGARNILDEVLEEGSEGQKHEAEQLLQQIS